MIKEIGVIVLIGIFNGTMLSSLLILFMDIKMLQNEIKFQKRLYCDLIASHKESSLILAEEIDALRKDTKEELARWIY